MNQKAQSARRKAEGFSSFVLDPVSFAFAVCCAMTTGAHAQILNDPTRPPTAAATALDASGEPVAVAAPALLQSVMITPNERMAIIGGEWIKLGGKYGEARVVKITESEVVLQSAKGFEILRMYPDVSMKPVEPEQPAGNQPAAKKRVPAATRRTQQ
jgi:MSHA biogenesis protein MshK